MSSHLTQMSGMETTESSLPEVSQQDTVPIDWSDLPADMLEAISKKLHGLFDFIYFRAVCKRWRATTRVSDLPPQVPWLFFQPPLDSVNRDLHFYSVISGKTRTIHCPQSHDKVLQGPSQNGYLYARNIAWSQTRHSLLNPFTKHEVIIESTTFVPNDIIGMGPDPVGSDDHIAFESYSYSSGFGFYQPRRCEWKTVEWPEDEDGYINIGSYNACLKGMYFINQTSTRNTVVVDILRHSSFSVPPPENLGDSDFVYFVESARKILRIVRQPNCSFNIYQLHVGDQNIGYRWAESSGIGDQTLFLDWRGGMSITAYETTGLGKNCIYYLQNSNNGSGSFTLGVYKYNIEDGRTEKIPCSLQRATSWFVPHIVGSFSGSN